MSNPIYRSARWRRCRAQVLKLNPLCVYCKLIGRVTTATDVDHITPLSKGGAMWDQSNLQALCKSCHGSKSARQQHRHRRWRSFALLDEDGYVIDVQ